MLEAISGFAVGIITGVVIGFSICSYKKGFVEWLRTH